MSDMTCFIYSFWTQRSLPSITGGLGGERCGALVAAIHLLVRWNCWGGHSGVYGSISHKATQRLHVHLLVSLRHEKFKIETSDRPNTEGSCEYEYIE
jgi:hypothetical protein